MIVTVLGARPQFIKSYPISQALKNLGIGEKIIHTGQHYDESMSGVFWTEMGLLEPDVNLGIGGGTHATQTGSMMIEIEIEKYLMERKDEVDAVLVFGDTNSTLAAALAASKLHIKVIHIEAGLRSFNKTMPEEINRILTDHVSDLLFCSSKNGVDQLAKESVTGKAHEVGDIMYDSFLHFSEVSKQKSTISEEIDLSSEPYHLLTLHRPYNTDNKDRLELILNELGKVNHRIIWPVHPRNKAMVEQISMPKNIELAAPFSYLNMLAVINASSKIITDSGGLQKEAYWAKKPCVTIRPETEWIETIEKGWNVLAGNRIEDLADLINSNEELPAWTPIYGDGKSAVKMASLIQEMIAEGQTA